MWISLLTLVFTQASLSHSWKSQAAPNLMAKVSSLVLTQPADTTPAWEGKICWLAHIIPPSCLPIPSPCHPWHLPSRSKCSLPWGSVFILCLHLLPWLQPLKNPQDRTPNPSPTSQHTLNYLWPALPEYPSSPIGRTCLGGPLTPPPASAVPPQTPASSTGATRPHVLTAAGQPHQASHFTRLMPSSAATTFTQQRSALLKPHLHSPLNLSPVQKQDKELIHAAFIQCNSRSPSHSNQRRKRNKRNLDGKRRSKTVTVYRWQDAIHRES